MSTTETQAVPAGTWAVDKVHSNVGFAVDYMAGTFTGIVLRLRRRRSPTAS